MAARFSVLVLAGGGAGGYFGADAFVFTTPPLPFQRPVAAGITLQHDPAPSFRRTHVSSWNRHLDARHDAMMMMSVSLASDSDNSSSLPFRSRARAAQVAATGVAGYPEPGPAWLVDERDACGVGFIANPQGKAEHKVVARGLTALGCMEHRGACLADNV